MNKLIIIVPDGLNAQTALGHLGFMEHLVEMKQAAVYRVHAQLPTLSRPLYEVLQTGVPVWEHGIFNNNVTEKSTQKSLFELVKRENGKTAAAAYHWIYDLYTGDPCRLSDKRMVFNHEGFIEYGIYYWEDTYPDSHVFADGDYLIRTYKPNYILIHSMELDEKGHRYGCDSREYMTQAVKLDTLLSTYLSSWRKKGYDVVMVSDHGMNEKGQHSGSNKLEREVALYIVSDQIQTGDFRDQYVDQLEIAPLCCKLLGIDKSPKMRNVTIK